MSFRISSRVGGLAVVMPFRLSGRDGAPLLMAASSSASKSDEPRDRLRLLKEVGLESRDEEADCLLERNVLRIIAVVDTTAEKLRPLPMYRAGTRQRRV